SVETGERAEVECARDDRIAHRAGWRESDEALADLREDRADLRVVARRTDPVPLGMHLPVAVEGWWHGDGAAEAGRANPYRTAVRLRELLLDRAEQLIATVSEVRRPVQSVEQLERDHAGAIAGAVDPVRLARIEREWRTGHVATQRLRDLLVAVAVPN